VSFCPRGVKMSSINRERLRSSAIPASPAPIRRSSIEIGISIGRFLDIGDSLKSRIQPRAPPVRWIIIIIIIRVIPSPPARAGHPGGVTYPYPLFFISRRYKGNALLISRLLAVLSARLFSLFSFSRDRYWMIRTEHFVNFSRPFSICFRPRRCMGELFYL